MIEPNELDQPDPKPMPPPNDCQQCDGSGYADDPNYTGHAIMVMPCKACHPDWWKQMVSEGRTYGDAHSFPQPRRARESSCRHPARTKTHCIRCGKPNDP